MISVSTDPFLLIAITPPQCIIDECARALYYLEQGIDFLHVRKPQFSLSEMRDYLRPFCLAGYASRIVLHSHFKLSAELGLRGIHVNEHAKQDIAIWTKYHCTSVAIHQLTELNSPLYQGVEYAMVSPIFSSISKINYHPTFSLSEFAQVIKCTERRVVALGGVTPERIPLLRQIGCCGAAFLGYLWQAGYSDYWKATVDKLISFRNE